MKTHSIIALAGSVIIVAASLAVFAHSTRPPAYDISLAPSSINGVEVQNLPTVIVTGHVKAAHAPSLKHNQLSVSGSGCTNPRTLTSLRRVMPYYSFARSLTSLNTH